MPEAAQSQLDEMLSLIGRNYLTKFIMKKNHTAPHDTEALMEDAKELLSATAHVAEEKVIEARKRLTTALEKGRVALENMQEKAVATAKATDQIIRENPYRSLGVALGVGALIGYLLSRRNSK